MYYSTANQAKSNWLQSNLQVTQKQIGTCKSTAGAS